MDTKVLIDSDVLIDYLREVKEAVDYIENEKRDLYISSINIAELYSGAKDDREIEIINEFLSVFTVIDVTRDIAEKAGLYRRLFSKSHNIGIADAIIAACSNHVKATLVSLNKKHFPMFKDDRIYTPYKKR
jgi:hypothetical protein